MSLHRSQDGAAYVRYLNETPKEAELLFAEMPVGVASFLRDADAWQEIEKTVLPPLVARCPERTILRAWVRNPHHRHLEPRARRSDGVEARRQAPQ
jgi:two-component system CheB/CheR fusion protein